MTRRWTADQLAIALLTLACGIAFFDVLALGDGFVRADLFRYHYPMKQIVREMIFGGEFPWWNRLYSGGQPMAANPAYEIFYPGQWPILLGTYRFGFHLHIALHAWLAMTGMYALLRVLGASVWAGAIAGVSFGLGGFFFGFISTLPTCFVWSWTPLALCFLVRYWRAGARRDLALASIVLGVQMLVGEPVALIQSWILLASAAVWFRLRRSGSPRSAVLASLRSLLIGGIAAVSIAAVQLLPAADHLRDTSRVEGLSYHDVVQFSAPPGRAMEWLFPHAYGHHRGSGPYFWGLASHGRAPYFLSIYFGLLMATGALAAAYAMPRDALAAGLFCAFWYLVALGRNTPFFDALYDSGAATMFRYPEKFLAITIIPMVVLGSLVFDRFLRREERAVRAMLIATAAVAVLSVGIAIASRFEAYGRWFIDHWKLPAAADAAELIALSRRDWAFAAAYALALLAIIVARSRMSEPLVLAALLTFVVADLQRVMPDVRLTMPAEFFEAPGIVRAFAEGTAQAPLFHIGDWYSDTTQAARFGRLGDRYYWITRNALLPPIGATWRLASVLERDYDETYLQPTRRLLAAMRIRNRMGGFDWWVPFATMSSAAYVLDFRDFDAVAAECAGDFRLSRPVTVRRARAPLPRYYFATTVLPGADPDSVARTLQQEPFAARTAFINGQTFVPASGQVVRSSERSARAVIEVHAAGRALLVMNVTPHRYWTVTIDGKPVRPIGVNLGYQGVFVERGRHMIEMRYRNPLVLIGGAISLLAIAVTGALAWIRRR